MTRSRSRAGTTRCATPRDQPPEPHRRPERARHLRRDRRPVPQEAHAGGLRPRQPRAAAARASRWSASPAATGRTRTSRRSCTTPSSSTRARRSDEDVWKQLAEGIRFVPGEFDDDDAFDRLARDGRRARRASAAPGATTRSTCRSRRSPSRWSPSSCAAPAWPSRARRPVAPRRHREAVRPRPRVGARAQRRRRVGLPAGLGLPHRPLPRQGDGPEHPGAALRQPAVRADLERATTSTTCRSPWPRTSASAAGPATTTASARPATSSRTTCCSCWP